MSRVTQTILAHPELAEQGIAGNCMQAAIASLLDLPLMAVPHFAQFVWWPGAIEFWARGRGLTRRVVYTDVVPEGHCILAGGSPRSGTHCVVAEGDGTIWDPHPSQDGLISIVEAWFFEPWPTASRACYACGSPGSDEAARVVRAAEQVYDEGTVMMDFLRDAVEHYRGTCACGEVTS